MFEMVTKCVLLNRVTVISSSFQNPSIYPSSFNVYFIQISSPFKTMSGNQHFLLFSYCFLRFQGQIKWSNNLSQFSPSSVIGRIFSFAVYAQIRNSLLFFFRSVTKAISYFHVFSPFTTQYRYRYRYFIRRKLYSVLS